jgi:hypothetical protein
MEDLRPRTALHHEPGDDIAVAAIVAGTAEDGKARGAWIKAQSRSRHRGPRFLHQAIGIDSGFGGGLICRSHFDRRQEEIGKMFAHAPIQLKKRLKNNRIITKTKERILSICLFFHRLELHLTKSRTAGFF